MKAKPPAFPARVSRQDSLILERSRPAVCRPARRAKISTEAFESRILMAGDVSGVIFGDMDRDGVRDPKEIIVPNAQITAFDANNQVVGKGTSDSAGKFKLNVSTPSNRVRLKVERPGSNLAPMTSDASVGASPLFVPCPCPIPAEGELCGNVFDDLNNDGVRQAGEPGIGGVTLKLSGKDFLDNPVSRTVTTAADGTYCFKTLPPSNGAGYSIQETQPAGFDDGKETPGTLGGVVSANDVISKIVIPYDEKGKNYDFGEIRQRKADASIQGSVYVDANNDGIRQGPEAGIPNAKIQLTGTDDLGNPVNLSTMTDANGNYKFNNLKPGKYTVTETQPAGFDDGKDTPGSQGGDASVNDVISKIHLGESVNATGYNFGELVPANAMISGSVYVDANNDGIRQGTEAGIPNAKVQLTGTDDLGNPVNLSTMTDANGNYKFNNLRSGKYEVRETQPAGFDDGKDTPGSSGGDASVNDVISKIMLGAGVNATGYNFGELVPANACIQGSVYVDANNDGIRQGGEAGIPNAKIQLTGTDDLGNPVNLSVMTDANGNYKFANLRPGKYEVRETQPAGFDDGKDTPGSKGGDASVNDVISKIMINAGDNATGYNFGELVPANACIQGSVYVDANNDGIRQGGEAGIPNAKIQLTGTDDLGNPVNLSVMTDANGNYKFANLRPGKYEVRETQPAGFDDGKDTPGSSGGDASVNDVISKIMLGAGVNATGYNFGERVPANAMISGSVYVDANNNGIREGTEAGIPNAKVRLTGADDFGNPVNLSTMTDANGNYKFNGLLPGKYTVTETQPAGFDDGKDTPGSKGGDASVNDVISKIILKASENATGYNFGELIPANAMISGSVYVDANDDGVRQGTEAGIPNAKIQLTGTDVLGNPVNLSTMTDANGNYKFNNLRPGKYAVTETQPAGFDDGKDTPGSKGGDASVNDVISKIMINAGDNATGYNFGECRPASLSGRVYNDLNNNGKRDANEPGIAGVRVALVGVDDRGKAVFREAKTNDKGEYVFDNLRPGRYELLEKQPSGFLQGTNSVGSLGGVIVPDCDIIKKIVINRCDQGTGYDFGEVEPSCIHGVVYVDKDRDGKRDSDEPGISGVCVTLKGTDDLGRSVHKVVYTDKYGKFSFDGLRPGTYTLIESQPKGYKDGAETIGDAGGDASVNDVISNIKLKAATKAGGYAFGEKLYYPYH